MHDGYLKKTRVFWHELGHCVAQQCNHRHYGGEATEYMSIKREATIDENFDYIGVCAQKNRSSESILRHPASSIASAAYGCIFQCLKYDLPIPTCLTTKWEGGHGHHDRENIYGVLIRSNNVGKAGAVMDCIKGHFTKMKNNEAFKDLFSTDISDLIRSDEEEFDIDLPDLHKRFEGFIALHEESYKQFVTDLESVLRPHVS